MTLLKKISGIRGTIGGQAGKSLSPIDIVEMCSGFGSLIRSKTDKRTIVMGRDARISGPMVSALASNTLIAMGFDILDLGLSTTPTVEMAVKIEQAAGGIILTASHNGKEWNALKLLNAEGEFISEEDGTKMLEMAASKDFDYATVDKLGAYRLDDSFIDKHIDAILDLELINADSIRSRAFKVVVDCINSTGAISIAPLLDKLNCSYELMNAEMTGEFSHDPEPLPKNLTELAERVKSSNADLGIAVDPDVDRLVLVSEDGSMFGEEYTIVAAADYVLKHKKSPTVSNMSSSRALADVAAKYGQEHFSSAVGEVNVVNKMKACGSVIGGEGNGGVILPELHYGRDALAGIALILNLLTEQNCSLSELRAGYPDYIIIKEKFEIDPEKDISETLQTIKNQYIQYGINEEDGLRIDFDKAWVHLRKSNTEPVLRLIAEAETESKAIELIDSLKKYIS